jgi:hypothetical protein
MLPSLLNDKVLVRVELLVVLLTVHLPTSGLPPQPTSKSTTMANIFGEAFGVLRTKRFIVGTPPAYSLGRASRFIA